jgi:hypothetical protein
MVSTSSSTPPSASSSVPPSTTRPEVKLGQSTFTTTKVGSFALFCVQHPDLFRFVVQVAFSATVLSFCINQLAVGAKDGKNDAIYWGGVTSILAWWMPSPGGRSPQNQANIAGNLTVETPSAAGTPPSTTGSGTTHNAALPTDKPDVGAIPSSGSSLSDEDSGQR